MAKSLVYANAQASRAGSCGVTRVTFYNGNAAVNGVRISHYDLASTNAPLVLIGPASITSQFDFDGFPFPGGFRVTPSDAAVTNIVIEFLTDDE